jgi:glucose/mannose-6-phosphate isomerase
LSSLDDVGALSAHDPGRMLQQVAELPQQLSRAAEVQAAFRGADSRLAVRARSFGVREALVCGMGGSAIGGDYAATWAAAHGVRVSVWRGYGLPAWIDSQQLLVFSSYSGDTEETLSAFAASPSDAVRLCIATGGELARRAREASVPLIALPPGLQPRAALGHSLVALLIALHESGLVEAEPVADLHAAARGVAESARHLAADVPESSNRAKQLARLCHEHLPFFYAGGACLGPVALRWKSQLHENAKAHAFASALPEMNHNEIMAWSALPDVRKRARLFFLHDPHDDVRVERRMRLTAELLQQHVAGVDRVKPDGDGVLQHMLTTTHLGDFASVYLAFLNGVDPTPVERIEALKRHLSGDA